MSESDTTEVEEFVKSYFGAIRSWVLPESDFAKFESEKRKTSFFFRWSSKELDEINKLSSLASEQRNRYVRRTHTKQMLADEIGRDLLTAFCKPSLNQKVDSDKRFLEKRIKEAVDNAEDEQSAITEIQNLLKSKVPYLRLKAKAQTVFRYRQIAYEVIKWLTGFVILYLMFEHLERRPDTILLALVALLYVRERLQVEGQSRALTMALAAIDQEFRKLRWILKAEMPEESWLVMRKQQQESQRQIVLSFAHPFAALPVIWLIFWKILTAVGIIS